MKCGVFLGSFYFARSTPIVIGPIVASKLRTYEDASYLGNMYRVTHHIGPNLPMTSK